MNVFYCVRDADGQIIKTGVCDDKVLLLQAEEGQTAEITKSWVSDATHYFDNSYQLKPSRPSPWHEFDYTQKKWVDNKTITEKNAKIMEEVRIERAMLFSSTDWTQMPDSPLTEAQRAEWAAYRQALRDVPQDNQSATSIDDIIWPTKPE